MFQKGKNFVIPKVCVVLLGLLLLLGCGRSVHSPTGDDSNTIAIVNGEPIVEAEYRLAQNLSALNKTAQHDQSLDRIVQAKIIQLEAVKYGLLSSASYASFQSRFNKENERRAQALEHKEVVYGPRQYTEENYYNDEFSRLVVQLKEALTRGSMDLSEETLKQQYESHKQEYAIQPTIELKAMIEPMASDLSSTKVEEMTINEDNLRGFMKYREELFRQANALQVGQFSPVFIDQGKYTVLYCSARTEKGYKTFSEVRKEIYLKEIDKQFQTYVEGLSESAKIQYPKGLSHN